MDDEEICLPQDTLNILNEFLKEKAEREELDAKFQSSSDLVDKPILFEENWQLSQFWYNEETKSDITRVIQKLISNGETKIGLLSCPSLYNSIKRIHTNTKIFEYDERFSAYGLDFIHYDFNEANELNYLEDFKSYFDILIVDPPFLSEECIEKISKIIKKLSKENETKILFCSGQVVEPWIKQYLNLSRCIYQPGHERNLGNEFVSYANFNLDELL